jgi:glycosyltransferase involved in cell wall biosynthesis
MQDTLVSCIVPVYNGERYLRETLESIFAQTHPAIEVIVADDGSTDGTAALARTYGDRLRYLRQENGGPAAARNLGIGAARGELIGFLDADDLWHPDKLTLQIERLRTLPRVDLCLTHLENFWSPDVVPRPGLAMDDRVGISLPGYVTYTVLVRRSVFDRIGGFDTALRHGDDTEWFLRAAEAGIVIDLLPDVLVRRRLHSTNHSIRRAGASRDEYLGIVKASLDRRRGLHGRIPREYQFPRADDGDGV